LEGELNKPVLIKPTKTLLKHLPSFDDLSKVATEMYEPMGKVSDNFTATSLAYLTLGVHF
jgi:hypothetical protein